MVSIKEELLQAKFKVSGKVTDQDGQGMYGVTVSIKGTQKVVLTDANGNYSIEVLDKKSTLVFSYVGYIAQENKLTGESTLNIKLISLIKSLDEVVVVGYGTQRKADLSSAISVLSPNKLTKVPGGLSAGLQSEVSGVQVTNGRIHIRGISSINATDPLYVVDGMI